jgi:hypothetical protein
MESAGLGMGGLDSTIDIWSVKVRPSSLFKNEVLRVEMPNTSYVEVGSE